MSLGAYLKHVINERWVNQPLVCGLGVLYIMVMCALIDWDVKVPIGEGMTQ